MKKKVLCIGFVSILCLLLLASIAQNFWYYRWGNMCLVSYLQDTDSIYTMESGILYNNIEYAAGENLEITYDFSNEEYPKLLADYGIEKTAGDGSEFERAMRLMNEYAPRLTHKGNFDNHVEMNALSLLEYSLNNPSQGINCRNKAQILNEMCLALGIYSRKVWILPYSEYDTDCHVVNEIWDNTLGKWIMLDITNNEYWVDEKGTPLSITEIRQKGAMQEFCTPARPGDDLNDLKSLKQKHLGDFLYIMKDMVYIQCCEYQTVGETQPIYCLYPQNASSDKTNLISCEAFNAAPQ